MRTHLLGPSCMFALLVPALLGAQNAGTVRGRVTDAASGQPVADARVTIAGSVLGATTLHNGQYVLGGVSAGPHTIVIRRVGYGMIRQDVDVTAGDTTEADVALRAVAVALEAIVVTGTGAPAERRVLGNTIESVPGELIIQSAGATAVDQALEGKITGALISQSTGVPGGGISIRLRGTSTVLGNAEPLWVVDGVIVDNSNQALISLGANAGRGNAALSNRLSDIAPGDIDRVEVLKGAAAAALYGSRANSGVIQIFTKHGREGPARVTVSSEVGVSDTPKKFAFNMAPNAGWTDVVFGGADSLGAPVQRYDIQDSVWRTGISTVTRASVSGGNGGTTYYLAGSYDAEQAIVQAEGRHRTSVIASITQQLRSNLTVRLNGNIVQTHSDYLPEGEQTQGVLTNLVFTPTTVRPFYDPNLGRYPYNPVLGPNALTVLHTFEAPSDVTRFIGHADVAFQPTPRITLRYLLGLDDYRQEDKYLQPPFSTSAGFTGSIENPIKMQRDINTDFTASYAAGLSARLGLTSTLGYRYTSTHTDLLSASATNLPVEQSTLNGATPSARQSLADLRTIGGFGEERLAVNDRLFLTGGVNVEAASAFGPDERWQAYPRASASWLLHEEPFFRDGGLGRRISTLRLRLAYGQTGGQPPNQYAQFDNYVNVSFAGKPGLVASNLHGNPGLRPERQAEIEGGMDLGLLRDRALAELTYYHRRTSDLVLSVPLPPSTGQSSQLQNVGVLSDRGWEAALTTVNVDRPNFTWRSRLSLAHDRNRVDKLVTPTDTLVFDYLNAVIQGQPIGVFFGGYYARNADGSIMYAPVNVTMQGKPYTLTLPVRALDTLPTGAVVPARRVIGDPNPSLIASLSNSFQLGRRLELSVLLDGRFGNKVANFTRRITELFGVDKEVAREITGDTIPRTFSLNPAGRSLIYEEYIEDGSFVKLREIALAIHFDPGFVRHFGAQTMDVRLAARNLHTWTNYRGLDPEVNLFAASTVSRGVDFADTPIPRSFTASVNFTF
jgi:TonB-linked SusC/RagA family outer membrane protein